MKHTKRVLIVLRMSGAAGRDILSGIFHFARSHPHWHTRLFQMPDEFTPENFLTEMSNGIDGIIASEPGPDETARQVCASSVPVSFIGDPGPILAKRMLLTPDELDNALEDAQQEGLAAVEEDDRIGRIARLTDAGKEITTLPEKMHIAVTVAVVLLSIASLTLIIIAGFGKAKQKGCAVWAAAALSMMFTGAVGKGAVPPEYFGLVERFSVFAAVGYCAVLGVCLFRGFGEKQSE